MHNLKPTSEEREKNHEFQRRLWSVAVISGLIIMGARFYIKATSGKDLVDVLGLDFLLPFAAAIIILAPKIMKLSNFQIMVRSVGITASLTIAFYLLEKLG